MTNFGPTKNDLWDEFNNLKTEKIVNYTRHSIMNKISSLATDIEEKNIIEKEIRLTWLIHSIHHQLIHFNVRKKEIEKSILQFRSKSGNNLEFYKKRLDKVKTPLLKSHYSFACFILEKKLHMKNMFNFIVEQIDYCLDTQTKHNLLNSSYLMMIAYNLNNIYNLTFQIKVNNIALKLIEMAKSEPKCMVNAIEVLAKLKIIKDEKLDEIINLGISSSDGLTEHFRESLLNAVILLCSLNLTRYQQTKNDIILKIAEMFEEASTDQESMIAIYKLDKAREYYFKLNNKEKIKEVNASIIQHTKTIDYTVTTHKIDLHDIEIKGNYGFERVQYIANYPFQIPRLKDIEKLVEDLGKEYPIGELFHTTHFNREKPISEESDIPQKIITQTITHINIAEVYLSVSVQKLERENLITPKNYLDFLETFGFYDNTSLDIILVALERHFQEDFVSSIHILIPQVELTLRGILEEKGKKITKADRAINAILLRELIDECKTIFDENVIHYLKIKYGEPEAMNQRNIVSHAFARNISDFNHSTSLSLIYILMRLLVLK